MLLEPSAELAVVIIDRIVHTIFVFIRPKSNNCPALSDLTTMTEDLWSHALKFLDKYRLGDEDGDYNCDNVDDYDDAIMERE